ncbi:MAG: hypothetical protein JW809_08930 [Pirellulales bacterium]|nr:hypothetical protein [Pirellulales bacterium]
MVDESASEPAPSPPAARFRLQFTLRTLLGFTAACALLMGMISWRRELGAFQFFLGASVCLTVVGIVLRRWRLAVVGLMATVAMYQGVRYSARRTDVTTTTGWHVIHVPILVLDARTGKPVPGATVQIRHSRTGNTARTNNQGRAELSEEMSYITTHYETVFGNRESSWIDFAGSVLVVEAPGRPAARVPLETLLGSYGSVPFPSPSTVRVKIE